MYLCFLCALSSSLDSLSVSISYGVKNVNLPFNSMLVVSIISTIGTFLSMYFGFNLLILTNENVINLIGSLILISLGLFFILESVKKNDIPITYILENPVDADCDNSGSIELKESITLAIALAINNIGVGIASAIAGLNIVYTTLFTFVITLASLKVGFILGQKYLSNKFGNLAQVTSGLLIVFIGIIKLLV